MTDYVDYAVEELTLEFIGADGSVLASITYDSREEGHGQAVAGGPVTSILLTAPNIAQGWPMIGMAEKLGLTELTAGQKITVPPMNLRLPDDAD